MSHKNILVEARELVIKYKYIVAIDNLSVKIPFGKILIVGSNGSGKTTFLKAIAGLVRPIKGYIRVFGYDPIREYNFVVNKILFVRDHDDIHYLLKVSTLIRILSEVYGKEKTIEAAESLELTKHIDKRICELSKGYRRRTALLEALITNKQLVMLDEPLSGLDYESREIISGAIRSFMKDKAVIIASHLPVKLCFNHLIILEAGKLVYSGNYSENLVSKYFRFY